MLFALFHPVAVDGERGRVDDFAILFEAVRILDEFERSDLGRLVLELFHCRNGDHRQDEYFEGFAREKRSFRDRLTISKQKIFIRNGEDLGLF